LELFSVDKSEKITELGCGIGNKLFFLWKNGYANLTGYDLSQNAIKLAKSVNEKYGCGIKFDTLDIIKEIPSLEGQIIYTFTCLEQLPHYMETVINNLVSAKPKKVIHFEFALEYSTKLSRSYIKARDYQTNLLPLLKKDPRVSIIKCEPLNIGNPVNPLTCIEWKPS
jgi:trans-aconitate methyltransferase